MIKKISLYVVILAIGAGLGSYFNPIHTIEEKIVEMQKRKKGLVKKVVSCDDEAIAKLTWEDVLELLQTEEVTVD